MPTPPSYTGTGTSRQDPGVVTTVRFEGSARTNNANHTLRASVHDALWMLTQQHRAGEYIGTDNGSLVKSKMQVKSRLVNRYQPKGGTPTAYEYETSLDAVVEKVAPPVDMAQRMRMGRYFAKVLSHKVDPADFSTVFADYLAIYGFSAYASNDYEKLSNSASVNLRTAIEGKLLDGYEIYLDITTAPSGNTSVSDNVYAATSTSDLKAGEDLLKDWFQASEYYVDANEVSWSPAHLENRYKCSAPIDSSVSANESVLHAEHRDNDIDWHNFVEDTNASASINASTPADINTTVGGRDTVLSEDIDQYPSDIRFRGATVKRWWQFEDKRLDFAKVRFAPKDALKMLVMDYTLAYSSNWLSLPVNLRVGSITEIEALSVQDSFGINTVISAAGAGASNGWQNWSMFTMNQKNSQAHQADAQLFVPPVNANYLKSDVLEKVVFTKDEMANLIWAVEETLKTDSGMPVEGHNAHNDLINKLVEEEVYDTQAGSFVPEETQAELKYQLMRNMPENWIPFMAVSTVASPSANHKELAFRRAKVRRVVQDFVTDDFVTPRTSLLQGASPFDINEEELLEGNITLSAVFKRTRWWNGSTRLWYNYTAGPSSANYTSGLEYDVAINPADERLLQ